MLDLDHTLVNSAKFEEVGAELAGRLEARAASDAARLPARERQLHRLPRIGMWTKLRPGARAFLAAASARFELWIHTNGTRCGLAGSRHAACFKLLGLTKAATYGAVTYSMCAGIWQRVPVDVNLQHCFFFRGLWQY